MKVLLVLAGLLALGTAQYYYPQYYGYGYSPNVASQMSNANSGAGGTSIATGTANANQGLYGRDKRSAEPQAGYGYYPYGQNYGYRPLYGYGNYGYSPNVASQTSNANSGFGGTSIASGTANANQGLHGRDKRSAEPQAGYGYYPYGFNYGYRPNLASQTSNANSGFGGTSIASGTANANQGLYGRDKRSAEPQYVYGYGSPHDQGYGYGSPYDQGYGYRPLYSYGNYGYSPNVASQVSNANSGAGGTSIATGTANANQGLTRDGRTVLKTKTLHPAETPVV